MKYVPKRALDGTLGYTYGGEWANIYGGRLLENIVQFLARIVIMHCGLRMAAHGFNFAIQEHDALAYVVPEENAAAVAKLLYLELKRRPSWALDLPIEAELGIGPSYGETVKVKF
jgi:DNA polymerase